MSRRKLGLAGLAVTIGLNGGVAMLPAADAAPACVTYTDPAGDGIFYYSPVSQVPAQKVDEDQDLDILDLTLNNTATELIATISVKKLAANPAKAPGHGFTFGYTLHSRKFEHSYYKYGQAQGDSLATSAEITYTSRVNDTVRPIPVTATFDLAKSVVTLKVRIADVESWSGGPAFDAPLSAIYAGSGSDYFVTAEAYDTLKAPAEAEYRVRYGCGADVVDLGNPPKPPVRVTPDIAPRAGCAMATDAKGDGIPSIQPPAKLPNDPNLDIVGFSLNTTATEIKAFIQVDKLGDKPSHLSFGDRFEFSFGYDNKVYTIASGRLQPGAEQTAVSPNRGQVNGATNAKLKPTAKFDKTTNTVSIGISREQLAEVHGAPIPLGAELAGVNVTSYGYLAYIGFAVDRAVNKDNASYFVGHSPCFLPPAAKLAGVGTPSAQFGDAATLSVKLTSEDGGALSGKKVTFNLGSSSGSGTTNASGVATATLVNTLTAGDGAFTASFAGDDDNGPGTVTAPFKSVLEKTKMTLSVVKSGAKRTVTATLKDDDGKPVAGQTVAWTINGKSAGSAKTDALGKVVLKTAKPTQTVIATFAGVTGKYVGAKATAKV